MLDDRVRRPDPKRDVEEHVADGFVLGPGADRAHEHSHLLVARPPKPDVLRDRADPSRDLGRGEVRRREPLDLGAEAE
jgi:hypothetical protein